MLRIPILVSVLVACVGCGSDLPSVTGTITLDGQPLENAFVEFTPQEPGGSMSYGRTDANGRYDLMFSLNKRGAVPGENVVRITTADVGDMGKANTPERVPVRYNRNSELRVMVEPRGSNVLDFELTTDGAKILQPKLDSDA
jgi:hypothetical protein